MRTTASSEAIDIDRRRLLTTAAIGVAVAGAAHLLPSHPAVEPTDRHPSLPGSRSASRRSIDLRRRIAATRWPDKETVTDQSQGVPLAKLQELVRYWGNGLRLAQGGSEAECLAAIHRRTSTAWTFTSSTSAPATERAAADHHARLAGIGHRAAQDHRSAHGSNRARRQRRGCFRRRHPVLAGLRLLRQADRHRLGPRPHRARLGGADEAPRLHALRRAGRRLGHAHLQRDGAPGSRRIARHPHQLAGDGTARGGRGARAAGPLPAGLSDKERAVFDALMTYCEEGELGLLHDDDRAAADGRLRRDGLTGRPRGVDPRASRLRAVDVRRRPQTVADERRRAGQHHAVLADEHGDLVGAAVLGERRTRQRHRRGRAEDRRDLAAGGHHGISGGRLSSPRRHGPGAPIAT